jgi:hypothetical protein
MSDVLLTTTDATTTLIRLVQTADFENWRASQDARTQAWLASAGFSGKSGQTAWLPDAAGNPGTVVVGWDGRDNLATLGGLPFSLPTGVYRLEQPATDLQVLVIPTERLQNLLLEAPRIATDLAEVQEIRRRAEQDVLEGALPLPGSAATG